MQFFEINEYGKLVPCLGQCISEPVTHVLLNKEEYENIIARNEKLKAENATLLKIHRERSNADRKLRPKKNHSGYIVMHSTEKPMLDRRFNKSESKCWQTDIETPYSVDIPEGRVRQLVVSDLKGTDNNGIAKIMGIDIVGVDDENRYDIWGFEGKKILFELYLRANFRKAYWDAIIVHSQPLGSLPKELKPIIYIKNEEEVIE